MKEAQRAHQARPACCSPGTAAPGPSSAAQRCRCSSVLLLLLLLLLPHGPWQRRRPHLQPWPRRMAHAPDQRPASAPQGLQPRPRRMAQARACAPVPALQGHCSLQPASLAHPALADLEDPAGGLAALLRAHASCAGRMRLRYPWPTPQRCWQQRHVPHMRPGHQPRQQQQVAPPCPGCQPRQRRVGPCGRLGCQP